MASGGELLLTVGQILVVAHARNLSRHLYAPSTRGGWLDSAGGAQARERPSESLQRVGRSCRARLVDRLEKDEGQSDETSRSNGVPSTVQAGRHREARTAMRLRRG